MIVRVDHAALARGHARPDEICEISGVGPVPVTEVVDLLTSGDAFTAVVATDASGQVTTVAHVGRRAVTSVDVLSSALTERGHDVTAAHGSRRPDAYQLTALDWTTPTCSVAGCDLPRQEIDHRHDWARTHRTKLDDLDRYCSFHHRLKGRKGYRLEPGTGRRRQLPPGDP